MEPGILHALLVEDDSATAELCQLRLARSYGSSVVVAHEGALAPALERLRQESFDVVLLDLTLPDSAGMETVRRAATAGVPIVVLTGAAGADVGLQALRAGAQDYISKNEADPDRLVQAMRHACERHRLRGQVRRLVMSSPVAMIVKGADGNIAFANPAAARLLGRPAGTLVGWPLGTLTGGGAGEELIIPSRSGWPRTCDAYAADVEWDGAPALLLTLVDVTERRRLAELRRYHSPAVINWMIEREERGGTNPLRPMEATVLFADIAGFTGMAESMEPLECAAMLEDILGTLTEVVFQHDGTLDKYLGDGLMAVFGAPMPVGDHSQRAARAALRMHAAAGGKLADHGVRLSIGLNSGRLLSGRLRCQQRLEYTVLGDVVNVASRLCDLCAPGATLLGEQTRALLGEGFPCTSEGVKHLRNREACMEVYRLSGERATHPE